jgi:hypothetical protein
MCDVYQPTGEKFCLNEQEAGMVTGLLHNGFVDKFKANGTPDGRFPVEVPSACLVMDNLTGFVQVDSSLYDQNGGSSIPWPTGFQPEPVVACAAKNGIMVVVQPTAPNGNLSWTSITGPIGDNTPPAQSITLGTNLQSIALVVMGGKTYIVAVDAGSSPAIWMVDTSTGAIVASQPIVGVTANLPGGSAITTFDSLGVGVVTSFGDNIAIPFSETTLKPTAGNPITLPGTPVSATAVGSSVVIGDTPDDPVSTGGTFTQVNPVAGTATVIPTATTPFLPVGTSSDPTGKVLWACPQDAASPCVSVTLP